MAPDLNHNRSDLHGTAPLVRTSRRDAVEGELIKVLLDCAVLAASKMTLTSRHQGRLSQEAVTLQQMTSPPWLIEPRRNPRRTGSVRRYLGSSPTGGSING